MTACLLDRAMTDSNIDYGAMLSFKQIWRKVKKTKKKTPYCPPAKTPWSQAWYCLNRFAINISG